MVKHSILVWLCIISLILSCVSLGIFLSQTPHKLAYVRSHDLVYGYQAMQAAHEEFSEKRAVWEENLKTLENEYEDAVTLYNESLQTLNDQERKKRKQLLEEMRQQFFQYKKSIESKAEEEDRNMTEKVLNEINEFVELYGKSNGYDLIFGTTLSGNILYGDQVIDITDELLIKINQ